MADTDKDIYEAVRYMTTKINNKGRAYKKYDECFLFGTENQEGINTVINYEGKKVLTTAASGDQYLGAMYYGADKVNIYDINRLSSYMAYLRIASLRELSYEEFLRFSFPFIEGIKNNNFWNKNDFKKILEVLPSSHIYYWENLMQLICAKEFNSFISVAEPANKMQVAMNGMPFYRDKDEYNKLKDILIKKGFPQYHEIDINNFDGELEEKFDLIYLSNILDTIVYATKIENKFNKSAIHNENEIEYDVTRRILGSLANILKEDGMFLVNYRNNTHALSETDYMFNNEYFEVSEIEPKNTISGPYGSKDLVLTYKPKDKGFIWNK